MILSPIRKASFGEREEEEGAVAMEERAFEKSRERVDSEKLAQEAVDKAWNSMELRQFLEENKTNQQKYEEILRKVDSKMQDFDTRDI